MVPPRTRPSASTLRWVQRSLGGRAEVVAWRRMTGGIASTVHRLTVDDGGGGGGGGERTVVVLRQYEEADAETTGMVHNELAVLRALGATELPTPEPIAADADGGECDGRPSLLMTRLPGRIDLTPADPEEWVRQIAATAARIHAAPISVGAIEPRLDADDPEVPASARRPAVWRAAYDILREPAPDSATGFVHRDLQHFNLLWRRGRLTGVVDWTMSGTGPVDFDLGHCRLNLAVLFGPDRAERLRHAYEAETGRAVDPWWDLYAVTGYGDDWRRFIPIQVAGRAPVEADHMTDRVEQLVESIVRRA